MLVTFTALKFLDLLPPAPLPPVQRQDAQHKFLQHEVAHAEAKDSVRNRLAEAPKKAPDFPEAEFAMASGPQRLAVLPSHPRKSQGHSAATSGCCHYPSQKGSQPQSKTRERRNSDCSDSCEHCSYNPHNCSNNSLFMKGCPSKDGILSTSPNYGIRRDGVNRDPGTWSKLLLHTNGRCLSSELGYVMQIGVDFPKDSWSPSQ